MKFKETLQQEFKREGYELGLQKGSQNSTEEMIKNMILQGGCSNYDIVKFTNTPMALIRKIRARLKRESKL